MENQDAYKSIYEALTHAGAAADAGVKLVPVDAEDIEELGAANFLTGLDGILVPGGFGVRGVEGKILAARFARTQKIPYLGLCLGMQIAVVDFARDVLGLARAHSTEFNSETPDPVISMLDEQKQVVKLGGTMRLGASVCHLVPGTKIQQAYGTDRATERHRHRYEFNNLYREKMEAHGLVISGTTLDGKLVELIELAGHPWFAGCQFHPEFHSKPNQPHPLFSGFVKAAVAKLER
jgi:CTP synthase